VRVPNTLSWIDFEGRRKDASVTMDRRMKDLVLSLRRVEIKGVLMLSLILVENWGRNGELDFF